MVGICLSLDCFAEPHPAQTPSCLRRVSPSQLHLESFQTDRRGPAPGQDSANIQVATICPFSRSNDFISIFPAPWMRRFAQAESCTQKPWQMVTSGRQSAERTALRATSRTPDPKPRRRTVAKTDTVERQARQSKYRWYITNRTLSSMADPREAIPRTKNPPSVP